MDRMRDRKVCCRAVLLAAVVIAFLAASCAKEPSSEGSVVSSTSLEGAASTTTATPVTVPSTASMPATDTTSLTSTTLGPGVMSFQTCVTRFETLIGREFPELLPYSAMPEDEVGWLRDEALPFTITDAKGYRFSDGSLTVLLFMEPLMGTEKAMSVAREAVETQAIDRYQAKPADLWVMMDGDFGYIVVSRTYRSDLGRYAHWARQAPQPLIDGEQTGAE